MGIWTGLGWPRIETLLHVAVSRGLYVVVQCTVVAT